ncbi:GNAT family N-acetyltransferase [Persicobacter diffluens]|uniref:N-acetyltransferase domain-containing protein n=1 Tax=Persicobacter diffluens TaxID=981 RepID=A0AAN4VXI9_9BACT|nr:hypothetical protein PEDI_13350 [Persicobacter diffluens]
MEWKKHFETDRLKLRPFVEKDHEPFTDLVEDRKVVRFLSMPTLEHLKSTKHLKDYTLFKTPEGKEGLTLLIRKKEDGEFVGITGLRPNDDPDTYHFFCALQPAYWLKGYAKEAGQVVFRYAFEEMNARVIKAGAEGSDIASVNFLNSMGMRMNTLAKPSLKSTIKPFELKKEDYGKRH